MRELGVPFPELSDDPFEQWQVHEAVMLRYSLLGDSKQRREQAVSDAREQADAWARERRGGG